VGLARPGRVRRCGPRLRLRTHAVRRPIARSSSRARWMGPRAGLAVERRDAANTPRLRALAGRTRTTLRASGRAWAYRWRHGNRKLDISRWGRVHPVPVSSFGSRRDRERSFVENSALAQRARLPRQGDPPSDGPHLHGGVHADITHLAALAELARREQSRKWSCTRSSMAATCAAPSALDLIPKFRRASDGARSVYYAWTATRGGIASSVRFARSSTPRVPWSDRGGGPPRVLCRAGLPRRASRAAHRR